MTSSGGSRRRAPLHTMRRIVLTLILSGLAGGLAAQEPWSLDRCIAYGLEHNTGIREQDIAIEIRRAELQQMRGAHLPVIRAGIGQDWNWGRSVDMQELLIIKNKLTKATGASLNASAALFEGFSRHHARLAAKEAVSAARHDAAQLREDLCIDITRAYLQLMLAKQILSHALESLSAIEQQRERTAGLVEAGSQPKTALSEMEAQVASEKAAMVEASCRVRSATLVLTRLMNLPPGEAFATGEAFSEMQADMPVPPVSEAQVEAYLLTAPELQRAQADLAQMRHRHAHAKAAFMPRLLLSGSYGTYYSSAAGESFRTQLDENRNPSLSLQLEIPVFQALQARTQLKKSRLACDQAQLEVEKARIRITDEIRSAVIEADNSYQQYRSAEETLHAMQSLLEVTEAKYNLGAASALDYILARNNHAKAVSDFLQAKWQYLFRHKLLEHYLR